MKGKILQGSICFTDLMKEAKAGNKSFSRGKNGKVYFNFTQFINDEPDKYDNDSSLLLNPPKENRDDEKIYFGNAKFIALKKSDNDRSDRVPDADDDLPF